MIEVVHGMIGARAGGFSVFTFIVVQVLWLLAVGSYMLESDSDAEEAVVLTILPQMED